MSKRKAQWYESYPLTLLITTAVAAGFLYAMLNHSGAS